MLHLNRKLVSAMLFTLVLASCALLQTAAAAGNVGKISQSDFTDPATNTLYVVGEIINTGDTPIENTNVKVIFYNSLNEVITSKSGPSDLNVILVGRRSFFNVPILQSEGSLNVHNYTVWFNWTDAPAGKPLGLAVTPSGNNTDTDGHLHLTGQVQNQGTTDSINTEVSATFYNSSGTVIGTSWAFSNPSTLTPNQTGTFDLELIYASQVAQVENYRLCAESSALAVKAEVVIPEFTTLLVPLTLIITATAATLFLKRRQLKPK